MAQMVTTPLRRGTRRRSTRFFSKTPKWAQACSPSGFDTPTSLATSMSSYPRGVGRSDTQSTNSSFKWAPQALVRSWHGKLSETYTIETIIGEGRSGAVLIVQHKTTEKYYACKVLVKADHDVEALRGEIQTLRRLDHPNVVRLFETHEDADNVFMLMELCHGGDLFDKIADEQTIAEDVARVFARQMLSALAYCHANGVIHRDIKPENFLLETDDPDCDSVKLADFGIATSIRPSNIGMRVGREVSNDSCSPWPSTVDMSSDESMIGSLPYMAPETLRGNRKPLAASDLWSCGVTIYVMLSGTLPFGESMDQICSGEAPDFSGGAWGGISEEAVRLLRRLLQPNPEERLTAKQALAHEWFGDLAPEEAATPGGSFAVAGFDDPATDGQSLHRLATIVLHNLRRWRQMPKLRRIAIGAIAKRLEGQHDAHHLAETCYSLFSDSPDTLRCDRLAQVLGSTLSCCPCTSTSESTLLGGSKTPSSLFGGMMTSPSPSRTSRSTSGTLTGLHVRQRVKNTVKRIAGTPMSAQDGPSPASQVNASELKYLVSALDGMKDGSVDYTLLVAAMLTPDVFCDEQHIADAFPSFDVQKRGYISSGDLRDAVRSSEDPRKFGAMLAQFDLNGDGVIDFSEFHAMVSGSS